MWTAATGRDATPALPREMRRCEALTGSQPARSTCALCAASARTQRSPPPRVRPPRQAPAHGRGRGSGSGGSGGSSCQRGDADGASGESAAAADDLLERLTRAMGELLAPSRGADGTADVAGSLIQVWLPAPTPAPGAAPMRSAAGPAPGLLATRGQPFTVSASSNCDALAAFRYASTHYAFAPDVPAAHAAGLPVGVPGRVFVSGRAELSPDVQLYDRRQYPRLPDAVQCGIRGTLAMPVFDDAAASPQHRRRPAAVIELATSREDVEWGAVIGRISDAFGAAQLSTCATARVDAAAAAAWAPPPLGARSGGAVASLVARAAGTPGIAFAQAWRLCAPPPRPQRDDGAAAASPAPPCLQAWTLPHACAPGAASAALGAFRAQCCDTPLCEGQGLPGVALARGAAEWTGAGEAFDIATYPLIHFAQAAGLRSGCALRLELPADDGGGAVVVECLSCQAARDAAGAAALLAAFNGILAALAAAAEQAGLAPAKLATRKRSTAQHAPQPAQPPPPQAAYAPAGASDEDDCDDGDDGEEEEPARGGAAAAAKRTLSREVLYDHFRFGLKEASERLEMCPTTLKRICRTHGVARWPSRKKYRNEISPRLAHGGLAAAMELMEGTAAPNAHKRRSHDSPRAAAAAAAAAAAPWPSSSSGGCGGSASGSAAEAGPAGGEPGAQAPPGARGAPLRGAGGSFSDMSDGALLDGLGGSDVGSDRGKLHYGAATHVAPAPQQQPQPQQPQPAPHAPPHAPLLPLLTSSLSDGSPPGVCALPPAAPPGAAWPPAAQYAFAGGSPLGAPHALAGGGGGGGGAPGVSPPVAVPAAAPGASRFCHTCGAPLKRAGAAFCHMCGTKQDD
jgi:hypothetical protein